MLGGNARLIELSSTTVNPAVRDADDRRIPRRINHVTANSETFGDKRI